MLGATGVELRFTSEIFRSLKERLAMSPAVAPPQHPTVLSTPLTCAPSHPCLHPRESSNVTHPGQGEGFFI